jgi:hypothetical protein
LDLPFFKPFCISNAERLTPLSLKNPDEVGVSIGKRCKKGMLLQFFCKIHIKITCMTNELNQQMDNQQPQPQQQYNLHIHKEICNFTPKHIYGKDDREDKNAFVPCSPYVFNTGHFSNELHYNEPKPKPQPQPIPVKHTFLKKR